MSYFTENFLSAQWQNLIMANYEIDPEILKPYIPNGLELDFYQGSTFVSLVGFMFKNTRIFNISIPYFGDFQEVNLRFYVLRKDGDQIKRGVVFIKEIVPYKSVAWIANVLYQEQYIALPSKNKLIYSEDNTIVAYKWKSKSKWNHLEIEAESKTSKIEEGNMEEFILDHYYGYTKSKNNQSLEYEVRHPRWETNGVNKHSIECNFKEIYGDAFGFLSHQEPHSVMFTPGSDIAVKWKRSKF